MVLANQTSIADATLYPLCLRQAHAAWRGRPPLSLIISVRESLHARTQWRARADRADRIVRVVMPRWWETATWRETAPMLAFQVRLGCFKCRGRRLPAQYSAVPPDQVPAFAVCADITFRARFETPFLADEARLILYRRKWLRARRRVTLAQRRRARWYARMARLVMKLRRRRREWKETERERFRQTHDL